MTTQNDTAANSANNGKYFDNVLMARAIINDVRVIKPAKGDPYCAIKATIIDKNGETPTYTPISLNVKGDETKAVLKELRDQWPVKCFGKGKSNWIADINIGSISHNSFLKKNGEYGASLTGRLIRIRGIKIGNDIVHGEFDYESKPALYVATGFINLVDLEKKVVKAAILEGQKESPETQSISLIIGDKVPAPIQVLESNGMSPKGYAHRETNAKVFATLEMSGLEANVFTTDEGEVKSYLTANLTGVRYLKADDQVITPKKGVIANFIEGFKEGVADTAAA